MVAFFRRTTSIPLLIVAATTAFAGFSALLGVAGRSGPPAAAARMNSDATVVSVAEPTKPSVAPWRDHEPIAAAPVCRDPAAPPTLPIAMLGVLVFPKPPLPEDVAPDDPPKPTIGSTGLQPAQLRPPPQWSARELQSTLLQVPEIWLQHPSTTIVPQTGRVRGQNHPVLAVIDARPDLQGLAVRRGPGVQLPVDEAVAFRDASVLMRKALSELAGQDRGGNRRLAIRPEVLKARPDVAARVMHQMLQIENPSLRKVLLGQLKQNRDPAASKALAHRAVYEPLADIRQTAVSALVGRPLAEFLPVLLTALSSPWPPAADHAADALVKLGANDAVPELIRLLERPAATDTVRELVRVNHARNCLLCHAQSVYPSDDIRVQVPSPVRPLPASFSLDTYEGGGGGGSRTSRGGIPSVFARPDITYLQQEFSWMLPVANSGYWPALQRFDFVIRTRPADEREKAASTAPSSQKQAIVRTLQSLTGREFSDLR